MTNEKTQAVRGTQDFFGEQSRLIRWIEQIAWQCAQNFAFEEIQTPMFEFARVYQKTLGEASDIVTKEMYSFEDKGGELLTLRPEGTAGVARAFISHQMARQLPLKFYYKGPMFRYERPQKGRYRQFHQIGVELLGVESLQADIEVIALGHLILTRLGLIDRCTLQLNSLGDTESRANYKDTLVDFLESHRDSLSEDSQKRIERNPLRVLDSKDVSDQEILQKAPKLVESLSSFAHDRHEQVKIGLQKLGVSFVENPYVVRGLDYYDHSVFEFTTDQLGAQGAVLAGGRYDGLIGSMGGPPTAGCGWGAGIERLALMIGAPPEENTSNWVAVVPVEESALLESMNWTHQLRAAGFRTEQPYSGNLSKKLKKASKGGARWAVLIGGEELSNKQAVVKDFLKGSQETVSLEKLISFLQQN